MAGEVVGLLVEEGDDGCGKLRGGEEVEEGREKEGAAEKVW